MRMLRTRYLVMLLAPIPVLVGWGLVHMRTAEFTQALPVLPTDIRSVLVAHSTDGEHWTVDDAVAARPADTPDLVALGEQVLLYSLHGEDDVVTVRVLGDDDARVIDLGAACDPAQGKVCVDPAALALPGGGVRLYLAQADAGIDPATASSTRIISARSPDGFTFRLEEGARLEGAAWVDPDPVRLPDGSVRLYVSRLVQDDPRRGPRLGVESALSSDGLDFQVEAGLRLTDASATRTVAAAGHGWQTWFHDIEGRLRTARSPDGLVFRVDREPVLDADPLPGSRYVGVEAPGVLVHDGAWTMVFSSAREPWWPINLRVAREAQREARERQPAPQ